MILFEVWVHSPNLESQLLHTTEYEALALNLEDRLIRILPHDYSVTIQQLNIDDSEFGE